MSKLNKILIILVIVLLAALAGIFFWQKIGFQKPYYAVYLTTGDLYFGNLSRFPSLSLFDVWFLQSDSNSQTGLKLTKFANAVWGPNDRIQLNKQNIVWINKLSKDSQVIKLIKDQKTLISPSVVSTTTPLTSSSNNP